MRPLAVMLQLSSKTSKPWTPGLSLPSQVTSSVNGSLCGLVAASAVRPSRPSAVNAGSGGVIRLDRRAGSGATVRSRSA